MVRGSNSPKQRILAVLLNPLVYQATLFVVCAFFLFGGNHPPAVAQTVEQMRTDTQQTDAIVTQQKTVDFQEAQIQKLFVRQNALDIEQAQQKSSSDNTLKTFAGVGGALQLLVGVFTARLQKTVNRVAKRNGSKRPKRDEDEDDEEDY